MTPMDWVKKTEAEIAKFSVSAYEDTSDERWIVDGYVGVVVKLRGNTNLRELTIWLRSRDHG